MNTVHVDHDSNPEDYLNFATTIESWSKNIEETFTEIFASLPRHILVNIHTNQLFTPIVSDAVREAHRLTAVRNAAADTTTKLQHITNT